MQKGKTFSNSLRDIHPEKLSSEICRFSHCTCVLQFYKLLLLHLDGAYIAILLHLVRFFLRIQSVFEIETNNFNVFFSYKESSVWKLEIPL